MRFFIESCVALALCYLAIQPAVAQVGVPPDLKENYMFMGCRPSPGECNTSCPVLNRSFSIKAPEVCEELGETTRAELESDGNELWPPSIYLCFCRVK